MKKIVKSIIVFILVVFCLSLFSACNNITAEDSDLVSVTDMDGSTITIPKNPQKVSCCRSAYDLLIAFGLGDKIDGVDKKVLANPWTKVFYPDSINHFAYEYEGHSIEDLKFDYLNSLDDFINPGQYVKR